MTTPECDTRQLHSKASPRNKKIEVERKFVIDDNCEQRIADLGGTLSGEEYFRDDYFDTLEYRLTLSDYWLRRRNGVWELKYPPTAIQPGTTCLQYCETKDEREILELISKVTGLSDVERATNIEDFVASTLTKFASIKSNRRSYRLNDVRIDLDSTDFGFRIGELEICVDGVEEVAGAVSRIDTLAATLGMTSYATYDFCPMLSK